MEFLLKLKKIFFQSSLKKWLIYGVTIIVLITIFREIQLGGMISKQMMTGFDVIDSAEKDMEETRKFLNETDRKIDESFDKSFKEHKKIKESSDFFTEPNNIRSNITNKINKISLEEKAIVKKEKHTIEDIKEMRLTLEATLNKLLTVKSEDILTEYIKLQKNFENLLIEFFVETKKKEQQNDQ